MRHSLIILSLLFFNLILKGQGLENAILQSTPLPKHPNYIAAPIFSVALPNKAISSNFGRGVSVGASVVFYPKKQRVKKLGIGFNAQGNFDFVGGSRMLSALGGIICGYSIAKKIAIEAKILSGLSFFAPGDFTKVLGYNEGGSGDKCLRTILGLNCRYKLTRKIYVLAGMDYSMGKVSFSAIAYDHASDGSGSGWRPGKLVEGTFNITHITIGLILKL